MSSSSSRYSRRGFLKMAGMAAGGGVLGGITMPLMKRFSQPETAVSIVKTSSYSNEIYDTIRRVLADFPDTLARVKDGVVLLKPNIVDHYKNHPVNTHPAVVAAAIGAFRHYGAREVIVAEGPGHRRDIEMLIEQSGFADMLNEEAIRFVDLNFDAISPVPVLGRYSTVQTYWFANTLLNADLIVSMPKMKTHHWTGVTLALKNMFGTIPGVKYGWPKNFLHWHGISESIVDINATLQPGFAIVDGVEGMEGDGPLHGTAVNSGLLIMGDNLTAVDATTARIMNIIPENIDYLRYMMDYGGVINPGRIQQLGESIASVQQDFHVLDHVSFIKSPLALHEQILIRGW